MKSTCIACVSSGIVLPVTLVLLLVLAISGTSLLQVVRRAEYSSSGYVAHLESFYRAEAALRATENALADLVFNCPDAPDGCPGYDSWVKVGIADETGDGRQESQSQWQIHPHSSAVRGQIAYRVEFIEQGSFVDTPGVLYDIYRVSARAGGSSHAAYSSLSSMIALCVANAKGVDPACSSRGFRGSWRVNPD